MADFIVISELKNSESNIINNLNTKFNDFHSNLELLIPKIITVGQSNTIFNIIDTKDYNSLIGSTKGNSIKYIYSSNFLVNISLGNSTNLLPVDVISNQTIYKIDKYILNFAEIFASSEFTNLDIPSDVNQLYIYGTAAGGWGNSVYDLNDVYSLCFGGGGGAGEYCLSKKINVIPNSVISIKVPTHYDNNGLIIKYLNSEDNLLYLKNGENAKKISFNTSSNTFSYTPTKLNGLNSSIKTWTSQAEVSNKIFYRDLSGKNPFGTRKLTKFETSWNSTESIGTVEGYGYGGMGSAIYGGNGRTKLYVSNLSSNTFTNPGSGYLKIYLWNSNIETDIVSY